MMSENYKNVPLIIFDFSPNEVRGTHLVFFRKMRFQGFISEIFSVVSLLREKFVFFFQNQNDASTSDIREVVKF